MSPQGCSFQDGFAVLKGNTLSNLSTIRDKAHQQHLQLLDLMNQEPPEDAGKHGLCFLIAPITNVARHQDLLLEYSLHSIMETSQFPPVTLSVDTSVDWCQMSFVSF
jgi:hypothetical protein